MKVLNLYAGIGGNRKLWGGVEVTAVELNPEIAHIYSDFYPDDEVIIDDANQYLLNNYKKFDFIWSSPPCQSHSKMRFLASKSGSYDAIMPDLSLYSEIIFLKNFCDNKKWIVENVNPYYDPLIYPTLKLGRHLIWSNFHIIKLDYSDNLTHNERGSSNKGFFDLTGYKLDHRKDQIIRNSVNPELGLHIYNSMLGIRTKLDVEQQDLFSP